MPAKPDPVIHAYVRAHATLRLVTELPPATITAVCPKNVTVQLAAPGGPVCSVTVRRGQATFRGTRRAFPTVTLWFPRAAHMGTLLAGGKAPVVPIPSSPRFLTGVNAFRALTGAVQESFQNPEHRIRLLLMGTLYALQVVANRDAYVAARATRIPPGMIGVSVDGDDSIRGWLQCSRPGVRGTASSGSRPASSAASGPFTAGSGEPPFEPNAELVFADRETAEALLTGTLPAMLALAERRVRLFGRIPMIQNLFPILDRVAVYMGGQS